MLSNCQQLWRPTPCWLCSRGGKLCLNDPSMAMQDSVPASTTGVLCLQACTTLPNIHVHAWM